MAKKSNLELAGRQLDCAQGISIYDEGNGTLTVRRGDLRFVFEMPQERVIVYEMTARTEIYYRHPTVGDLCKFMKLCMHETLNDGLLPPPKLKGTGAGGLEEVLMQEAARLEKKCILTMGRYPVASVIVKGSTRPIQVPSLPDFEGIICRQYGYGFSAISYGEQFLIEAKVVSGGAFEVRKDKLKTKQVRHMLKRFPFHVKGWLVIHFNERHLATLYDEAFTVAIPIAPEDAGGHPVWEKFAADPKGKYVASITRAEAREMGVVVPWKIAPGNKTPRPDILSFLAPWSQS